MTFSDQFEEQLTQAIVRQFFENPPVFGTLSDGTPVNIPARPTPAQAVAARLLTDKNNELLDAIMSAIDIDTLAGLVAVEVQKTLLAPDNRYGYTTPGSQVRKRLKERVDTRLVELLAQEMYAKMQEEEDTT